MRSCSKTVRAGVLALTMGLGAALPAQAAGGAKEPMDVDFQFEGPFGTWNYPSIQRGLQVYRQICSSCHKLENVPFRTLTQIGFSEDEVKAIAEQYQVDTINDYGEVEQKPAGTNDEFPSPFPNEQAAKAANNNAYPPNLSLITKAREHGPEYVYSLMQGYVEDSEIPEGVSLAPGQYYNEYMDGHKISMPRQLYPMMVMYDDGTEATVEQMSRDIANFLTWAAEPDMIDRKRMGINVLGFLFILSVLLYMTTQKVWKPVKEGATPWKDIIERDQANRQDA
ncbi:hypothetical protein CCR85_12005 [Rhodothalassium salexigens]|uniref:cytochrome c1 n=1 Tax=Rhodothalassium salexigens TaxID=1086 RepID=UPI0019139BF4|nr:cytochrome c1 [Rhodothalassium salexigens]MBK5912213.1 hypothetical protein [Rhodothalassium salexigens]MBK5919974.1 hypothetical protein [Rhodothalassium salexigens]